ncbi:hypothetical protein CYY_007592 [Polysphondylium violaceum]|uniref:DUF885 domain-containing protein n=1 Tax=Polysphondylium violaceum TaxID=133409 RepID=A0A8J4PP31_9MYCE|nr:hypothetical protein CYY_007592 [Polysphondylium violaceum]
MVVKKIIDSILIRFGIVSSLKFLILPLVFVLYNYVLVPLVLALIDIPRNYVDASNMFVFYILFVNVYGTPWTIAIFSGRMLTSIVENQYFLLTQLRVFDKYGITCANSEVNDLSPKQIQKNHIVARKQLNTLVSMEKEYGNRVAYLTMKDFLVKLDQAYFLKLYPDPLYLIYPTVYSVNHFMGAQLALIDALNKQQINSVTDANNFITRVTKADQYINGLILDLESRLADKLIPPVFVIDLSIGQIREKVLNKFENSDDYFLIKKLNDDLKVLEESNKMSLAVAKGLTAKLNKAIDEHLLPSYSRLEQYLLALKTQTPEGDGLWRVPNGEVIYNYLISYHTNTQMTAEEIHEIGKEEVRKVKQEILDLFRDEFPEIETDFGPTIKKLSNDPRYQFQEGDQGRQEIIDYYKQIIEDVQVGIEEYFEKTPTARCTVERVPFYKEAESAPAFYTPAPLDRTKDAIFYVNLRDTTAHTKAGAKDLCYHEAIPGHHFQISLSQEMKSIDIFRRMMIFTAYAEGWALYTERLADECGWYKDKYERLGFLTAEMWRSLRLVIDTGIHSAKYKWSRQQAIDYLSDNSALNEKDVVSEVERYIVMPGQACAYKIGQLKIVELREKAKSILGEKFKLKEFHSAVLHSGALPLSILELVINSWIDSKK